jgi:hypothetical protein
MDIEVGLPLLGVSSFGRAILCLVILGKCETSPKK